MAEKDNKSKYQLAKEKLEKEFGKGTVVNGSSKSGEYDVVSTGSLSLDIATGVGGLAYGKTVELMGWESSGKSTITLNVIANHQKKNDGRVALLIDGEHSFDKRYAKVLGVDVDKLEISQPDYGEMAYNIAGALIETGDVGVVVIDSQTSLLPKKSMEGEAGDHNLGLHARLMSIEMPKLMAKAAKYNTLLIVISQFREKIGVMFGSPVTTNGGNALKFYAHMRLEVSKTIDKDSSGEKTGNKTKVVVKKNKLACPFAEAEFIIDWGLGINRNLEIVELACEYGVIKKAGSWYSYEGNKIGQGEASVLTMFHDNPEFAKEIEDKVLNKINGVNEENNIEERVNNSEEILEVIENQPEEINSESGEAGITE